MKQLLCILSVISKNLSFLRLLLKCGVIRYLISAPYNSTISKNLNYKTVFRGALSYMFFFAAACFYPETFRISNLHVCRFETEVFEPVSFTLGYNDAVSFSITSECVFLEGIELEIKQNKISMRYPNTIAYAVYTDIKPPPAKNRIDYSARQIATAVLPNRYSHIIRIPFKSEHSFTHTKNSELIPYNRTNPAVPFMLRFTPVMKGRQEILEQTLFTVSVRPLLIAEGGLKINLVFPDTEQKPVNIQLNNTYLTGFDTLQLLTPGTYSVTISSDAYRTEVRSCIIERGKTTQLDIQLQSITPLLYIQAPENVTVSLDNRVITPSKEPIPVEIGTHLIAFKMGSYELTRQITVEEGKTYELTITMDVLLQERTQ